MYQFLCRSDKHKKDPIKIIFNGETDHKKSMKIDTYVPTNIEVTGTTYFSIFGFQYILHRKFQ